MLIKKLPRITVACLVLICIGFWETSSFAQNYAEDPFEVDYEIGVVGRKNYDHVRSFNLAVYGGLNPFNALITDLLIGAGINYNFLHWLGLDARAYYHFGGSTPTALAAEIDANPLTVSDFFIDFIQYELLGHVFFTPFYGKNHLFRTMFVNYIFYLFAGIGVLGLTQEVILANPNAFAFAASFGFGVRFYISSLISIGTELRDLLYMDNSFNDPHIVSHFVIGMFIGFTFPTFPTPKRKI